MSTLWREIWCSDSYWNPAAVQGGDSLAVGSTTLLAQGYYGHGCQWQLRVSLLPRHFMQNVCTEGRRPRIKPWRKEIANLNETSMTCGLGDTKSAVWGEVTAITSVCSVPLEKKNKAWPLSCKQCSGQERIYLKSVCSTHCWVLWLWLFSNPRAIRIIQWPKILFTSLSELWALCPLLKNQFNPFSVLPGSIVWYEIFQPLPSFSNKGSAEQPRR